VPERRSNHPEDGVRAVVESGRPEIVPALRESSNGAERVRFLGGIEASSVGSYVKSFTLAVHLRRSLLLWRR
jgi:hypothetical protein